MLKERVQLSTNLWLHEYFPKDMYLHYENIYKLHYLVGLLDIRLIHADQKLRDKFGTVVINNWADGGDREYSGFRPFNSDVGSTLSQHKFGRASDKLFHYSAEEVNEYIKKNWTYLGITCIEEGVTWNHTDVRYIPNQRELYIIRP